MTACSIASTLYVTRPPSMTRLGAASASNQRLKAMLPPVSTRLGPDGGAE
jgi:hypothetical protein